MFKAYDIMTQKRPFLIEDGGATPPKRRHSVDQLLILEGIYFNKHGLSSCIHSNFKRINILLIALGRFKIDFS